MLYLKDLKKSFRQPDGSALPILDIPEFRVEAGEQMVMVGHSGCGKTTLLHVIAGISRPDSGKVRIDEWDITLMPEAECDRFRAERIGYVFQTFNLLAGFSALENVLLSMRFARGRPDKNRAKQLLARVGLSHRITHRPAQLSVGEQQRVAVARALANKPQLLLAGRADGERRFGASAADSRFDPRDLPRRKRRVDHGDAFERSGRAVSSRRSVGGIQSDNAADSGTAAETRKVGAITALPYSDRKR